MAPPLPLESIVLKLTRAWGFSWSGAHWIGRPGLDLETSDSA